MTLCTGTIGTTHVKLWQNAPEEAPQSDRGQLAPDEVDPSEERHVGAQLLAKAELAGGGRPGREHMAEGMLWT